MNNPYTLTKEQYQELYKEVLLFAQIGGVTNDEDVLWKMCEEEFVNELISATEVEDTVEIIDAVADSFVVLSQLHHYYLSKPSWEQPLFNDTGWEYAPFYRLEEMILKRKENYVQSCMSCWLEVAEVCAKEYSFNLYKAIKEVNRSNMTKFPSILDLPNAVKNPNGTVDFDKTLQLVAAECESLSNGKYKDVVATASFHRVGENSDFRVVFRADNGQGKVCKYLEVYQEPNFDHCWI